VINRHDLFMVFTPRRMQRGPLTVPVSLCGARGIPRTNRTKGLRNTESNVVAFTYVYYAHHRVLDTLILRHRIIATLKITEVSVYGVGQIYPPLARDSEINRRQRFPVLLQVSALVRNLFHFAEFWACGQRSNGGCLQTHLQLVCEWDRLLQYSPGSVPVHPEAAAIYAECASLRLSRLGSQPASFCLDIGF
jgi:hypothetical protein